jgi:hypothetical protein
VYNPKGEIDIVNMIKRSPQQGLQGLFNKIAKSDNEIDSIFVFEEKTGLISFTNTKPSRNYKEFNAEILSKFLSKIINISDIEMLGEGKLEYTLFQLEGGRILYISPVPNVEPPVWLGFASFTSEGIGVLLFQSQRYLEKIHRAIAKYYGA